MSETLGKRLEDATTEYDLLSAAEGLELWDAPGIIHLPNRRDDDPSASEDPEELPLDVMGAVASQEEFDDRARREFGTLEVTDSLRLYLGFVDPGVLALSSIPDAQGRRREELGKLVQLRGSVDTQGMVRLAKEHGLGADRVSIDTTPDDWDAFGRAVTRLEEVNGHMAARSNQN